MPGSKGGREAGRSESFEAASHSPLVHPGPHRDAGLGAPPPAPASGSTGRGCSLRHPLQALLQGAALPNVSARTAHANPGEAAFLEAGSGGLAISFPTGFLSGPWVPSPPVGGREARVLQPRDARSVPRPQGRQVRGPLRGARARKSARNRPPSAAGARVPLHPPPRRPGLVGARRGRAPRRTPHGAQVRPAAPLRCPPSQTPWKRPARQGVLPPRVPLRSGSRRLRGRLLSAERPEGCEGAPGKGGPGTASTPDGDTPGAR